MKTAPDGTDRPIKPSRKNKKKPNKKDDVIQHKYTNKIVSYSEEGISILEKKVNSVCKKGSDIQEKKIVKKSFVKNQWEVHLRFKRQSIGLWDKSNLVLI